MKALNIASGLVLLVAVLALIPHTILTKIKPGETGVLNRQFGGGLVKEDFGPGFWLDLGPMHTWDVMDTTVQTLNMLRKTKQRVARGKRGRTQAVSRQGLHLPLSVKSAGGSTVTLDVTIKYRIKPGQAWQVLKDFGKTEYRDKVHAEAIEIMRPALGALDNEEFYDPVRRNATTKAMEEALQKRLDLMYIELIGILIRDLEFDSAYEEQIKQKTLAEQDKELQVSLAEAALFRGRTDKIGAETKAKVAEIDAGKRKTLTTMRAENDKSIRRIKADSEKYVVELEATANLYAAIKEANGIKLLKDAIAKGEALRRQALAVEGGNTLVALETVKNLDFGEMTISTLSLNPLDLEAVLKLLGAK